MSPLRGSPTAVTALSPLLQSTTASSSLANKPPCSVVRRNHHLLPRRPAHGCENCQFLLAELRVTRQLLECEIERNDELKQLHSSTMRTNPSCVRLGERGIKALTVELRARVRDIGRDVVGHQLLVRHKLVKAITHAQFIEEAPKHIDAALDDLAKEPHNIRKLRRFFGLLGGFLIATTGHRKGLITNMTVKEVKTAEKTTRGYRVIRIQEHKTQRYFGQAAIPLKPEEYAWFRRYNRLRGQIKGGSEASTFFHTTVGGPLLKLPEYFKDVWEGLNLGPGPTFNMLRSSVATFTKRHLGHEKYERVATFMCHDPQTAKRFYQADDPTEDTVQSRLLTMMAVSSYAVKEKKKKERSKRAGVDCDEVGTRVPQPCKKEFLSSASSRLIVSSSDDEGSGDWQSPKNGTEEEDSEEEEEEEETSVKQRVPELQKKRPASTHRNRLMVSSSDDEGSGDWQSPTSGAKEEGSVKQRVPQLQKKRPASTHRNRRSSELSSPDDKGSGDWQSPKNGTEEEDSEEEEKEEETSVKLKVPQLQKKRCAPTPRNRLMIQVYVSPATANILAKHSQNVGVKTKSETEMTSDQTKLCDTTVKIKRQEPSQEEKRKTCEEVKMKLQEEHQRKEEQHGEDVTNDKGRPRRKGPGGEEAVKGEAECLRRRGCHGDKEVKMERVLPRRNSKRDVRGKKMDVKKK
ncbi:hypothetical protein PAMP_016156 [Pampus punctatissimus]